MKEESRGKPHVLKIFQLIFGIMLVINSGLILTNPLHASKSLVLLLVITLIISGMERVGIGIIAHWIDKRSRITNIGLGIIAIILSIFAIAYPGVTISLVIMLMAFLIASVASSFGIVQTSPSSVAMAQPDQNNNMTDNKVSNMTDQLSMEGEILHDR